MLGPAEKAEQPGTSALGGRRPVGTGRWLLKWLLADAEIAIDGRRVLGDVDRGGGRIVPTVLSQPLLQRFRARDVHPAAPSATWRRSQDGRRLLPCRAWIGSRGSGRGLLTG